MIIASGRHKTRPAGLRSPSIAFWPAERALFEPPSCSGGGTPLKVPWCRTWVAGTKVPTDGCWIGIRRHPSQLMWGRRPKWEASRLAASGGVASSGHPVDGSAQGGRRRRWLVQFRFVHGVRRPITPGPVFGHVAERARLA